MGILLVAVVALAAFIYLKPDKSGFKLSTTAPDRVAQIRIEARGRPGILLRRGREAWEIVSPIKGRADQDAVNRILSILKAKSDQRIEAKQLSRFGLDVPVLRLTLDAEEFDFGMLNPLTQQQYVKTANGIYLVSPKYALIPAPSDLEAHAGAT
jgi:hypothetical protein